MPLNSHRILESEFFDRLSKDVPHQVVWDIETGPRNTSDIEYFFDASTVRLPPPVPAFDASRVRYGTTKDPMKRHVILQKARTTHAQAVADRDLEILKSQANAKREFLESAALKSHLGQVLAIGYGYFTGSDLKIFLDIGPESDILIRYWKIVAAVRHRKGTLFSWNGDRFDLPFVTQRSWMNELKPPYSITKYNKPEDYHVDAARHYNMGVYGASIKLDHAARALGVPGKMSGITGDQFSRLLIDAPERAADYLAADILSTASVCDAIGLFEQIKPILKAKLNNVAEVVA